MCFLLRIQNFLSKKSCHCFDKYYLRLQIFAIFFAFNSYANESNLSERQKAFPFAVKATLNISRQ